MRYTTPEAVPHNWEVGDIILDLYEVIPVGDNSDVSIQRAYHQGGFGRVYRVRHLGWNREMAVKVPRVEAFSTQSQKNDFCNECETWVDLGLNLHIATCHYVRELGGIPRVFSEYAPAGTLEEWIQSRRLYEGSNLEILARILDVSIQFAWGLHYAHQNGVIHQDVKPMNALMWNDGTLKVSDFGLARAREMADIEPLGGEKLSIMVSTGGMTPAYCSPEQSEGRMLNRGTDVWSWGLSVLQMFVGEVTWRSGAAASHALTSYLENIEISEDIPSMPHGVTNLLRKCFNYDSSLRPQSLSECANELRDIFNVEIGFPHHRSEPPIVLESASSLNNKALSLIDLGKDTELVISLFDKALEFDKHHDTSTYNRGLILWKNGKITYQELLLSLRNVEQERLYSTLIETMIGCVCLENADFSDATHHFEKAINNGEIFYAKNLLEISQTLTTKSNVSCIRLIEDDHTNQISNITISNDSNLAISGDLNGKICLWDLSSNQCKSKIRVHDLAINSLAISADNCFLASASEDKTIRLLDLSTGLIKYVFSGHKNGVTCVDFSKDGSRIISAGRDGKLCLWNASDGNCLKVLKGNISSYEYVGFSSDGEYALAATANHFVELWDIKNGTFAILDWSNQYQYSILFLKNEMRFITASGNDINLWSVDKKTLVNSFIGHTDIIGSFSSSGDEKYILSCSWDKTIRLWDTNNGRLLQTLPLDFGYIEQVALSPNARLALSVSEGDSLNLWNLDPIIDHSYKAPYFLSTVVNMDETINLQSLFHDYISCAEIACRENKISDAIKYLKQARDLPGFDKAPAAHALNVKISSRSRIKSYRGGWIKHVFKSYGKSDGSIIGRSVAFSKDDSFIYSSVESKFLPRHFIEIWDTRTLKCLGFLPSPSKPPQIGITSDLEIVKSDAHNERITSIAVSPDDSFIVTGSADSKIKLWVVKDKKCFNSLTGHTDVISSIAFSGNGKYLVSGGEESSLKLWDLSNGRLLFDFNPPAGITKCVTFSPCGRFILSGNSDGTIFLWSIKTGRCLRSIHAHAGGTNALKFGADWRCVISAGNDNQLHLWNLSSSERISSFDGHEGSINAVAVSQNSRFCVSGSSDKTVRLWEVSSGKCLRTFAGHHNEVASVAFSSDTRFLISGGNTDSIILWEIDWEYDYDAWNDPLLKT